MIDLVPKTRQFPSYLTAFLERKRDDGRDGPSPQVSLMSDRVVVSYPNVHEPSIWLGFPLDLEYAAKAEQLVESFLLSRGLTGVRGSTKHNKKIAGRGVDRCNAKTFLQQRQSLCSLNLLQANATLFGLFPKKLLRHMEVY